MDSTSLQTRSFKFGEHTVLVHCRKSPTEEAEASAGCFGRDEGVQGSEDRVVEDPADTVGWDVWDGATIAICETLVKNPDLVKGKKVLELGAGVGVVGILAGLLGARTVKITDYDEGALAIAALNIELNGLRSTCSVQKFDWGSDPAPIPTQEGVPHRPGHGFEVVLGSDLLYSSAMADKLRCAVGALLAQPPGHCSMLLSHQLRHSVTWNAAREPVVEDRDTVLERFLVSCQSASASHANDPPPISTDPAKQDAFLFPDDRLVYSQEGKDSSELGIDVQRGGYVGNEGDVCLFTLKSAATPMAPG